MTHAQDSEHWITMNSAPVLIDGEGNVMGGAGGKLQGKKLDRVSNKGPDRTSGGGSGGGSAGGQSSRPPMKEGHHELSKKLKIERETEKAYGVENPVYKEAKEAQQSGRLSELSTSHAEALRNRESLKWLPKSHASEHEGHVVGVAPWLAQKSGMSTKEGSAAKSEAFSRGKQAYSDLLSKAKAAGVPGVRERMKTETIKAKMKAHGVSVDSAMDSAELDDDAIDFINDCFDGGDMEITMDTARVADVNGWFEVKGNPLSMVGVFPYLGSSIGAPDPNRVYYVFRPADELAASECIESFKLLPWTDEHTILGSEEDGLTPAERKGVHGVIGEDVYFDGTYLRGNIKVWSESLAGLIGDGKRELSIGYRCLYSYETGVYNGQRYDAIQRQIRGNHLALVSEGRCGPQVAVLDGKEIQTDNYTLTIDGKDFIMAEPAEVKKEEGGAGGELTLAEIAQRLKELEPMVAAIGEIQGYLAKLKPLEAAEHPELAEETDKAPDAPKPVAETDACKSNDQPPAAVKTEDKAVDMKAIMAQIAQRDALAESLSHIVGTFDHADKTLDEVGKYGAEKLGIKCQDGQEVTAVQAYLSGRSAATVQGVAQDAASVGGFVTKYLKGE